MDNKYEKAKIKNLEQRLDSQKYNIKENKNKTNKTKSKQKTVTEIIKYIYEVCFKNRVFFFAR